MYFAWNIIHLLSNGEGDMNIENHISRGKYDFSGRINRHISQTFKQ